MDADSRRLPLSSSLTRLRDAVSPWHIPRVDKNCHDLARLWVKDVALEAEGREVEDEVALRRRWSRLPVRDANLPAKREGDPNVGGPGRSSCALLTKFAEVPQEFTAAKLWMAERTGGQPG